MIRVTTNGTLYNYKSNLMNSTNQLNSAMMKLMTGRNFDTYAANPAGATRAFQIHSSINATNAQYDNNQTVLSKFQTAWSSIQGILDGYDGLASDSRLSALRGLNDPSGLSTLNTQGQLIRESAKGIVQSLNAKYGDDFMFAGADTQNAPFAVETMQDGKEHVTYRGVPIDDADLLAQDYDGPYEFVDDAGNPITLSNQAVLDRWNQEHQYVDIGLGFELDANGVIPSTAFDSAISGLELTGYGVDGDGDPLNLVSTMLRLADIFEAYNEDTGAWDASVGTREDAERLLTKMDAAREAMGDQWVELDTQAKFLNTNKTQLEDTFDALNSELTGLEDVDQVDAILELSWAQMCYNAALQVGANVIPQSLMDYLN